MSGRHDKTLELTAEDVITARATCILGVAAGPLPGELPGLRGRVRLTLAAGGVTAAVDGEVNPGFASADRLVVRRSDQLDADTFLVNASAAAADLPAPLLAALREPGAAVEVTAAETGTPPPVLLVLLPGAVTAEVARLAAAADLVVDLTGRGAPPPAVPLAAPRQHGVPRDLSGRRTVVLLTGSVDPVPPVVAALPGARVLLWPPAPGADLLLAAGLPATPAVHAGTLPDTPTARRDLARRLAAAGLPAVLTVPPALVPPNYPPVPPPAAVSRTTSPLLRATRQAAATTAAAPEAEQPPAATMTLLRAGEQSQSPSDSNEPSDSNDPVEALSLLRAGEQRQSPADRVDLAQEAGTRPGQGRPEEEAEPGPGRGDPAREAGSGGGDPAREAGPGRGDPEVEARSGSGGGDPAREAGSGRGGADAAGEARSGARRDDGAQRGSRRDGSSAAVGELWAELPGWRLVLPAAAVGWGVGAQVLAPGDPADLRGLRRAPVIAVVPPAGPQPLTVEPARLARLLRDAGATGRDAAAVLAGLGVPRREAYRLAADPG